MRPVSIKTTAFFRKIAVLNDHFIPTTKCNEFVLNENKRISQSDKLGLRDFSFYYP